MNRPKWRKSEGQKGFLIYIDSLEDYCDALEKALDKACDILRDFDEMEELNQGLRTPKDVEQWKEWCMKWALKDEG